VCGTKAVNGLGPKITRGGNFKEEEETGVRVTFVTGAKQTQQTLNRDCQKTRLCTSAREKDPPHGAEYSICDSGLVLALPEFGAVAPVLGRNRVCPFYPSRTNKNKK
jgi:hypothetical protein